MRKFFLFTIIILFSRSAHSQIHEIGIFAGGSNYMGDIGSTDFVKPNNLAFGFLYKWNKSPRHSWRFSYMQATISGADSQSESVAKNQRDLSFSNSVREFSAGLEFNFLDFNLHDQKLSENLVV